MRRWRFTRRFGNIRNGEWRTWARILFLIPQTHRIENELGNIKRPKAYSCDAPSPPREASQFTESPTQPVEVSSIPAPKARLATPHTPKVPAPVPPLLLRQEGRSSQAVFPTSHRSLLDTHRTRPSERVVRYRPYRGRMIRTNFFPPMSII